MTLGFLKENLFPIWGMFDDFIDSGVVGVAKDFGSWVKSWFD